MTVNDIDAISPDAEEQQETTSSLEVPQKTEFQEFYLSDELLEALADIDYEKPTAIQRETIPLILAGIDLIAQAQTGTGKTAACAIPICEMLDPQPGRVEVLVMAPTRELAKQVCREFEDIGRTKGLNATAIYGGTSYEKQYKALKTAQIVAATPGRLLDLLRKGKLDLDNLRFFALDEADEMMSMGFREDIEAIVEFLPEDRQSLLFSATVNETIKKLAEGILFYPEYVSVSSDSVAAKTVHHDFYRVTGRRRARDLVRIIEYTNPENAIIFANTRAATFQLTEILEKWGYDARVLNGDLPQKEREKTLGALRQGQLDYLVATDVAARGIDISDLQYVINYELPQDPEVYVHRTGRTGRIGQEGKAISLIAPGELPTYMQLRKLYDIDFHECELPSTDSLLEAKEHQRLQELPADIDAIEHLPWGAKLGMAEQLLEQDSEELGTDRVQLVARLLALAEAALRRDEVRSALTRTPEALMDGERAEQQRTPESEAPRRRQDAGEQQQQQQQQDQKADRQKKQSETQAKSGDDGGDQSQKADSGSDSGSDDSPKRRRRRRSRSEDTSSDDSQGGEETSDDDSSGHRRRRRSRSDDQQETSSQEESSEAEAAPETDASEEDEADFDLQLDTAADVPVSKMYMDVGHDHFDNADELRDTLCHMSGMAPEDFGEIVLKSRYSFIEVREDFFYDVINAVNNQEYDGTKLTAEPARS